MLRTIVLLSFWLISWGVTFIFLENPPSSWWFWSAPLLLPEIHPHNMMLLAPCFTVGIMFFRLKASLFFLHLLFLSWTSGETFRSKFVHPRKLICSSFLKNAVSVRSHDFYICINLHTIRCFCHYVNFWNLPGCLKRQSIWCIWTFNPLEFLYSELKLKSISIQLFLNDFLYEQSRCLNWLTKRNVL